MSALTNKGKTLIGGSFLSALTLLRDGTALEVLPFFFVMMALTAGCYFAIED